MALDKNITFRQFLALHAGKPTEKRARTIVQLAASRWNIHSIGACPHWPSLETALNVLEDKGPFSCAARGFKPYDMLKDAETVGNALKWK